MKFACGIVFRVLVGTVIRETWALTFLGAAKFGFMNYIKNKPLPHQWVQLSKCKSGFNMFKNVILCDGKVDCSDGSDETIAQCSGNNCSPGLYRCNYGACISTAKLCDGILNCADGSDENQNACATSVTPPISKCSPGFFRCNYGDCIPRSDVCNGVFNCADGSDENHRVCQESKCTVPYSTNMTAYYMQDVKTSAGNTVEDGTVLRYACTIHSEDVYNLLKVICRHGSWKPFLPACVEKEGITTTAFTTVSADHHCSSGFFRCDYGACIPRSEVCNKVYNCIDGSDENAHVCTESECMVPYSDNMTAYYVQGNKRGGVMVEDGSILEYSCTKLGDDIYNLLKVICRSGSWRPFLPTCVDRKGVAKVTSSASIPITSSLSTSITPAATQVTAHIPPSVMTTAAGNSTSDISTTPAEQVAVTANGRA